LKNSQRLYEPRLLSNEDVSQELNVIPTTEDINSNWKPWGEYLLRMKGSRIPKIALECNSKSRRDVQEEQRPRAYSLKGRRR
jgi:hypothetical protein